VPVGVVSAVAERIRAATPATGDAPYEFVLRHDIDLSSAPPELAASLAARVDDPSDPLRGASMRAIGRMKKVDPATIDRIVRAAKEGQQASYDAMIALRDLGEQARPYAAQMIGLSPSLDTTAQHLLAQALLATGGDGVGAYAAQRLAGSNPEEHVVWMQGAHLLAKSPDAALAARPIAEIARSPREYEAQFAVSALARFAAAGVRDPAEKPPSDGVAEALADPRPARRAAALKAVAALPSLPAGVAAALAPLADDGDASVREAAVEIVASAWRFGADAKPLVPAALALLGKDGESAQKPQTRAGLLRTIGAAAPQDAGVRKALLAATAAPTPEERLAALYGLSRAAAPTAEEKRAVRAGADDPIERVRSFAAKVLELPLWK